MTKRDLGRITQPNSMIGDAELFRGWAHPSYHVAESGSVI